LLFDWWRIFPFPWSQTSGIAQDKYNDKNGKLIQWRYEEHVYVVDDISVDNFNRQLYLLLVFCELYIYFISYFDYGLARFYCRASISMMRQRASRGCCSSAFGYYIIFVIIKLEYNRIRVILLVFILTWGLGLGMGFTPGEEIFFSFYERKIFILCINK
jgi:hypothetical protein